MYFLFLEYFGIFKKFLENSRSPLVDIKASLISEGRESTPPASKACRDSLGYDLPGLKD